MSSLIAAEPYVFMDENPWTYGFFLHKILFYNKVRILSFV